MHSEEREEIGADTVFCICFIEYVVVEAVADKAAFDVEGLPIVGRKPFEKSGDTGGYGAHNFVAMACRNGRRDAICKGEQVAGDCIADGNQALLL